jgi:hypothetical protein
MYAYTAHPSHGMLTYACRYHGVFGAHAWVRFGVRPGSDLVNVLREAEQDVPAELADVGRYLLGVLTGRGGPAACQVGRGREEGCRGGSWV